LKLTGNWQHVVAKGEMSLVLGDGDDWGNNWGNKDEVHLISHGTGAPGAFHLPCKAK